MAPETVIHLETGELREGLSASARVFFVYVTPTGAEIPITKCPHLQKVYGRTDGGFDGSTRTTTTEYRVVHPCSLKMVNLYSVRGRPNCVGNLVINIDPEGPVIELSGVEHFGKFKGRGKVDMKRSLYALGRERVAVTGDLLKGVFHMKLLQAPKKEAGKPRRSLIF